MADPLIALSDAKDSLGITVTTRDTMLQRYLDDALALTESLLGGRKLALQSYTDRLSVSREGGVYTSCGPIVAVTNVSVKGQNIEDAETFYDLFEHDTPEIQDVVVTGERTIDRTDGRRFKYGDRNVTVTYTAGWTAATLPADIRGFVIRVLDLVWARRGRQDIEQESLGRSTVKYTPITEVDLALLPGAKAVIKRYKRLVV
jgi:hypothetical protein